jgi:hypothetical protein
LDEVTLGGVETIRILLLLMRPRTHLMSDEWNGGMRAFAADDYLESTK